MKAHVLSAACGLLAALTGVSSVHAQGTVEVGDTPSYSFRETLLQGQGIKSLQDLRGKPVLVEFWGMNCGPCVGAAVPGALKKIEEFGDDLEVIFVESQGHKWDELGTFGLKQKWFGRGGRWTTEAPFSTGSGSIPNYVLLDVNGKVLSKGNPLADPGALHDAIVAQIEGKASDASATPKAVAKAYKDFARGKTADALAALEKLAADAQSADAAAAATAHAQLLARVESKLARLEWSIANGEYQDAGDELKACKKALAGLPEAEKRLADAATQLASPELKSEIDAEKKLQKLQKTLFEEGPDESLAKQLTKFAEKYAGTKAADRATFWAKHAGASD